MNHVNAPDGTPLVFDAYEPQRPRAAVLLFHDWGGDPAERAERTERVAVQLKQAGVAAYALDQRGHGRSGGRRGHLSRFSQLLGDLQAFRRAARQRHEVPQILWGHGFGSLVVLRYLETQPGEPPVAAIVSNPLLGSRRVPALWKRVAARFADLWPTFPTSASDDAMTAGARAELQWAQRAIVADNQRIECPVLFLLSGADEVADATLARQFAGGLRVPAEVCWYPELTHDVLNVERVMRNALEFIAAYRSSDPDPTRG
jgi:lysophospholipase